MEPHRSVNALVVLALVLSAIATQGSSLEPSPFVGEWQAADEDGSDIRVTIGGPPDGPFKVTWTESYFGFCNREAGIARGVGRLSQGDPYVLEADLHLECFTTGSTLEMHVVWTLDPASNTLSTISEEGFVMVWHRPNQPPPVPDWIVIARPAEDAVDGGHFAEGTVVSLRVFDAEGNYRWNGYATAVYPESDPEHTWVQYILDIDLMAGDHLWMYDGVNAKELVVTSLQVTDVDLATHTVTGLAEPGSQVFVDLPPEPMVVIAGDDGSWTATFEDSHLGLWSAAYQPDSDDDQTRTPFYIPLPVFSVFPEWEYIEGWEWPIGATVTASVEGKAECAANGVSGHPEWDPQAIFVSMTFPEGCDVGVGDEVTLTDGATTRSHIVQNLAVTSVNAETDVVAGAADDGAEVHIWVHDYYEESQLLVSAEGGAWEAAFGSRPFDLQLGMCGRSEILDEAGNATAVDWCTPPAMGLRVNYGHDWVESFYQAGHLVDLVVTESDGTTVKATATVVTEAKDFWDGETGFQTVATDWSPAPPDLQANDWVFAQVDNGVAAQVQLGDIQGEVDGSADSITGTILAPWIEDPVSVECLDWGSGAGPFNKDAGSVAPNGSDPYACQWDPATEWDVQAWQDIGVGYSTPDGHWVANAFHDERWMAMWTHDLPSGSWAEGDYTYSFEASYTIPEQWTGTSDPLGLSVSRGPEGYETPIYDGYALIQIWVDAPQMAWTGSACDVIPAVHPDQLTRFVWGWVNDYSMTYDEAWAHFTSFTVEASWDGPESGSAVLTMGELLPFTGRDDRWGYRCSLTEHP